MKVVQDLKWYQLKSVEDLKIVEKDGAWQYFPNMLETWRYPGFLELAVMRAIHSKKAFCWCNRVCRVWLQPSRSARNAILCCASPCSVMFVCLSHSVSNQKRLECRLVCPYDSYTYTCFNASNRIFQACPEGCATAVRVIWPSIWKSCWLRNSLLPKEVLHSMQTNNLELALLAWNSTEKHWVFGNIAS